MEQFTMNNLPVEMIECILDKIDGCENRRAARLVCGIWQELLDRLDSRDCIYINKNASGSSESDKIEYFSELVPLFLMFRRQKIGINFKFIDLANTEEFWIEKGALFSELYFDYTNLPISVFKNMVKYCVNLKHVQLKNDIVESLLTEISQLNITNNCVKSIIIPLQSPNETSEMRIERLSTILQQISKTFPRLEFVKLYFVVCGIINELIPHLKTFPFKIIIQDNKLTVKRVVVFNYSRDIPFSVVGTDIYMFKDDYWNVKTYPDLFRFFSRNPLLEKLAVLGAPPIREDDKSVKVFDTYPKTYSLIRQLYMTFDSDKLPGLCVGPTNYFSSTFIASFPNLRKLTLFGVTFKTFKLICEFMPHLKKLHIANCINNFEGDLYDREDCHLSMLKNLKYLCIPPQFIVVQREIILNELEALLCTEYCCECKKDVVNLNYERMSLPKLTFFETECRNICDSNELLSRGSEEERKECFIELLKRVLLLYPKMETIRFYDDLYTGRKPATCEEMEFIFHMYRSNLHTVQFNSWAFQSPYINTNCYTSSE